MYLRYINEPLRVLNEGLRYAFEVLSDFCAPLRGHFSQRKMPTKYFNMFTKYFCYTTKNYNYTTNLCSYPTEQSKIITKKDLERIGKCV